MSEIKSPQTSKNFNWATAYRALNRALADVTADFTEARVERDEWRVRAEAAERRVAELERGWNSLNRQLGNVVGELAGERARLAELEAESARLWGLVQCLIDNDPDDDCADGVTILDAWRKDARAALAKEPPP